MEEQRMVTPPPEELARIRREAGTADAAEAGEAKVVNDGTNDDISREEREEEREDAEKKGTTTI